MRYIYFSWSFGVTLFEIYSLGQTPYQDMPTSELLKFLQEGNRLLQPELCPEEMSYSISCIFLIIIFRYEIMRQCWRLNADDRPTFDEVRRTQIKFLTEFSAKSGNIEVPRHLHGNLWIFVAS